MKRYNIKEAIFFAPTGRIIHHNILKKEAEEICKIINKEDLFIDYYLSEID